MHLRPPFDRTTIEQGKMDGQPCIRGIRITVRRVLEILANYPERRDLFEEYNDPYFRYNPDVGCCSWRWVVPPAL
jgi:uncharacterized protein (DUF433 family)